jgi:hypothetical protein
MRRPPRWFAMARHVDQVPVFYLRRDMRKFALSGKNTASFVPHLLVSRKGKRRLVLCAWHGSIPVHKSRLLRQKVKL